VIVACLFVIQYRLLQGKTLTYVLSMTIAQAQEIANHGHDGRGPHKGSSGEVPGVRVRKVSGKPFGQHRTEALDEDGVAFLILFDVCG